jgi:plasmid maintenance system antidote protein VapI
MVKHLDTSKEVWDYFESLYQFTNRATQMVSKRRSNTIEMKEGDSMATFLEMFQSMLNQMVVGGLEITKEEAMM